MNTEIWRHIFDSIEDPAFLHDAQFRVLFANVAYCREADVTEAEVLGKPYWEVFPPGTGPLPGCKDAIDRTGRGGSREEVRVGEKIFLSKSYTARDDQGKSLYALHILSDITAQKHSEATHRKSKDLLQAIVENIPARIFWKDRDSRFLGCNTLFAQDAGRSSPDELTGKTDFEMGWKDQAELYRADDKAVMESGKPRLDIEEPQTTPDGSMIWLRTSKVPLRDESKQIIGVLGIYQDITERKRAEEKLRETRDYLENLFNHANAPIIVWSPSYQITMFNHAFERLTSRDANVVIGKQIDILFPADRKDEALSHIHQTQMGERWESIEIPILCSSGEVKTVLWNSATLYSADGKKVVATMALGQDITARKLAESNLVEQLEELRRWHDTTLNREGRILELKHEVNDFLSQTGKHPRYPSAESPSPKEE